MWARGGEGDYQQLATVYESKRVRRIGGQRDESSSAREEY